MAFEVVIGLEVHAQLKTKSKAFCACSNRFGAEPNTNVCPVCLGLPGALPVLNEQVVQMAIKAGLALNSQIQHRSVFARKNYFYPDLPKGYQISQFDLPIVLGGHLDITVDDESRRIGITRIHIEEDAGKLVHQGADAIAGSDYSIVDLNRASVPLIEIVSEPDIRSAKEARIYMETLKLILEFLDVCDGNLDEGSLRADANISLRPVGTTAFGTRTEVKNLNSFRSIERAILSEIERQTEVLNSGGRIIQQTRHYDDATQTTRPLRSKEQSHDYRYFPEPDLPPLVVTDAQIQAIRDVLPELPGAKIDRYQSESGLSEFEAVVLTADQDINAYFEHCLSLSLSVSARDFAKWVVGDLMSLVKEHKQDFSQTKVTPSYLGALLGLVNAGKLSGKMAKEVLATVFKTGEDPKSVIKKSGATQVSDPSALRTIIDQVLEKNPDVLGKIRSGKTNSADFVIGQVMRETRGQANPDVVRSLLTEIVESAA